MHTIVLRSFLEVARQEGFSAAARTLHMTQPTISMQIGRLEESLGVRLFDRKGRKAALTPASSRRSLTAKPERINDCGLTISDLQLLICNR